MKILRVAGTNLASLASFEIDFRKLLGGRNEVFAIIGDTGAGKSTILDAICLGLYGNTPRIGKFNSKSGAVSLDEQLSLAKYDPLNIMTRGESSCSATVDFVANNGSVYRSCYEIVKRRTKFSRSFRISLLDDSGNIVRTEVSVDNKMIVQDHAVRYTGLTWDQFSKVIILPQGEFSAFLDDPSEAKIALLEKLTGTEVYKAIDEAARKRMGDLEKQLQDIKSRQDVFTAQLLTSEDIQAKEQKLSEIQKRLDDMGSVTRAAEEFSETRTAMREKEAEIAGAENSREHLKTELAGLQNENRAVALHDLAAPVRDLYTGIGVLKTSLEELKQKNEVQKEALGSFEKKYEESRTAFLDKERIYNEKNRERELKLPEVARAEMLEKKVAGLDSAASGLLENREAENAVLAQVQKDLDEQLQTRSAAEDRLKSLEDEHRKDEEFQDLVPVWNELNGNVAAWRDREAVLRSLKAAVREQDARISEISAALKEDAARYGVISGDPGVYSFPEKELPDAAPYENALGALGNWQSLLSGISDSVSRLGKQLDELDGNAAKFAGDAQLCQNALEKLLDARKDLLIEERSLDSRKADIGKAEQLEQKCLKAKNELSGLVGEKKTGEDTIGKLGQRLKVLQREQGELQERKTALEKKHEQDENLSFLKDSWNDLAIAAEKHRRVKDDLAGISGEISQKEKILEAVRSDWESGYRKYQKLTGDKASFSIAEEILPDAGLYDEAGSFLARCPKVFGELNHQARDLMEKFAAFLRLAQDYSETSGFLAGEREELLGLLDAGSPISRKKECLEKLEDNIRTCQGMIRLSEVALNLKPGEECPCCGSRDHPKLDGAAGNPESYLARITHDMNEFKKERVAVSDELSRLCSRKDVLATAIVKHSREYPGAASEIAAKAGEISGLVRAFRDSIESLKNPLPGNGNLPARIEDARKCLHDVCSRGLALPLFSGHETEDFCHEVSHLAAGWKEFAKAASGSDLSLETAKLIPVPPDSLSKTLSSLADAAGNIRHALEVFGTEVLTAGLEEISRIESDLRGIPVLIGELRNFGEKYRTAESGLEALGNRRADLEALFSQSPYSDRPDLDGIWQELTIASDAEYQSRVTELGETVKRINGYAGELGKLQTALEAKEAEIAVSRQELNTANGIRDKIVAAISEKKAVIAADEETIARLIDGCSSAAAFRAGLSQRVTEAGNAVHKSRLELTGYYNGLGNLRETMDEKQIEISSEYGRITGNLAEVLKVRAGIPENETAAFRIIRDQLEELDRHAPPPANMLQFSRLSNHVDALEQVLKELDVSGDVSALAAKIPAVPEIISLAAVSGELAAYGGIIRNAASVIEKQEKRIRDSVAIIGNARNRLNSLENACTARNNSLKEIGATESRMKELVLNNVSPLVSRVWKELAGSAEPEFKSGIAEYQKVIGRLSDYDGNHRAISAELAGLEKNCAAIRDRENSVTEKLRAISQQLSALEADRQKALNDIAALTGGLSVSGFRTALEKAVSEASADLNKAQLTLKASEKDLDSQNRIIQEGASELTRKETELSENEKELSRRLLAIVSQNPGYSEDDLRNGLGISEDEYRTARNRVQSLSDKIRDLDARIDEHKNLLGRLDERLSGLRERLPADFLSPEGELREEFPLKLAEERKLVAAEAEELRRSLKNNEECVRNSALCAAEEEKLRNNNSALYDLCGMFGTRSGFARYAQTITFGYLISRANVYIRDFTERRYELRQATGTQNNGKTTVNPFEIMVIDHDRGGRSRIVSSLSGGEKFRVALGLAFGLSDLVSSNVRVDNMFIDEGFDTLDNERLDRLISAMTAVSPRQIGIITHVDQIVNGAMIWSRIRVQKSAGDPSRSEVLFE
ncbi:AAA family ATPase [Succinimonas amylolytica]|uniref:AAA family ATPase n=1 Tax=Succinimonas amylolytica TaxID=83769 RepID=UPI000365A1A4|nr:AAA family ATPase [Succinimonas amylolytica]